MKLILKFLFKNLEQEMTESGDPPHTPSPTVTHPSLTQALGHHTFLWTRTWHTVTALEMPGNPADEGVNLQHARQSSPEFCKWETEAQPTLMCILMADKAQCPHTPKRYYYSGNVLALNQEAHLIPRGLEPAAGWGV